MLNAFHPMPWARLTRRTAFLAGGLGTIGLSLPQLLAAEERKKPSRPKSIILIVPWGGPGQMDTFDLKPDAPAEVRSAFKPINTNVVGTHICEHFPKLAKLADRYAIVRSMSHKISTHNSATHYVLTGRQPAITNRELIPANRSDWPCIGAVLAKLRPTNRSVPGYVQLPCPLIDNGSYTGGQHGGFFGAGYDPFVLASKDPSEKNFTVQGMKLEPGLTPERLTARRALLDKLNDSGTNSIAVHYERAYDLLGSTSAKQAFDLSQEPALIRERYGMNRHGQSVLLARRLVEAGVRLIMVSDTLENTNGRWDTHSGPVYSSDLKKVFPETDAALATLLEDLHDRGLLDSTVVAWMGEFGRTPKMDSPTGGRGHWPNCYSILLSGGGIRGGVVYGSSDKLSAFPRDNPVPPEDILATLYHCLGIDPHTMIADPLGRPMALCEGKAVQALMA